MNKTTDSFANFDCANELDTVITQPEPDECKLSEDDDMTEVDGLNSCVCSISPFKWFAHVQHKKHERRKRRQSVRQRRLTLQRHHVSLEKENMAPAPKRAKGPNGLIKPIFAVPVARPAFKFAAPAKKGPTTTKPFSFMARAAPPKRQDEEQEEHDSEIAFKGAQRVKAKARTISASRLEQLAQPRRARAAPKEASLKEAHANKRRTKSVIEVQRMMARAPIVQKSTKATTVPVDIKSALQCRAEERKQFDTKRNARLATENEQRLKDEEMKMAEEAEALKQARKTLGHRAAPIRQYKQVERIRAKQTTKPITPKFKTAKRKRNTAML